MLRNPVKHLQHMHDVRAAIDQYLVDVPYMDLCFFYELQADSSVMGDLLTTRSERTGGFWSTGSIFVATATTIQRSGGCTSTTPGEGTERLRPACDARHSPAG